MITSCVTQAEDPKLLADGFTFTEGPATAPDGDVYFTDQPNDRILRWDAETGEVEEYLRPAGRANGLFFNGEGELLAAADEKYELWSINNKKEVTVLAGSYEGQQFNGPNDIWVHPSGLVYFTDPYYQRPYWNRNEPDMDKQRVFVYHPDEKRIEVADDDLVQPNGIVGTPDGTHLYVADIGDNKTFRYSIQPDGSLGERNLFYPMGSDGMTLDEKGRVYLTGDGVTIINPDGTKYRHIPVPQPWTANVTFGGPEHDILFITASEGVYTLPMNVRGANK